MWKQKRVGVDFVSRWGWKVPARFFEFRDWGSQWKHNPVLKRLLIWVRQYHLIQVAQHHLIKLCIYKLFCYFNRLQEQGYYIVKISLIFKSFVVNFFKFLLSIGASSKVIPFISTLLWPESETLLSFKSLRAYLPYQWVLRFKFPSREAIKVVIWFFQVPHVVVLQGESLVSLKFVFEDRRALKDPWQLELLFEADDGFFELLELLIALTHPVICKHFKFSVCKFQAVVILVIVRGLGHNYVSLNLGHERGQISEFSEAY